MIQENRESDNPVKTEIMENAKFATVDQGDMSNTLVDLKPDAILPASSDIAAFLARPTEIYVSTSDTFSITPSTLLLSLPAIANKLANFYLMRATVCVRVEVSVNPYIYGQAILSLDSSNLSPNVTWNKYSALSNDYHVILDYAVNQSVSLKLPFTRPAPYALSTVGIPSMKLRSDSLFPATDASSTTTPTVTYRVYAWFEDVKLAVPAAQSTTTTGNRAEQKPGFISGIATKFEKAGNILSDIPLLGKYFGKLAAVSGYIGSIASIFGLSRPNYIMNDSTAIIRHTGGMANTSGVDVSKNLSMDPDRFKTILNIDNSPVDQLSFSYIALHYGYLGQINMSPADSVNTLYNTYPVMPCAGYVTDSGYGLNLTPLGFATLPFSQWHGSIEYKFTVICSKFHKGRVRIFWNPTNSPSANVSNLTHIVYIDIVPGNTATLTVPFATNSLDNYTCIWDIDNDVVTDPSIINGYIHFVLDMPISAPRAGAGCSILVEARAGPDFMPIEPSMSNLLYTDIVKRDASDPLPIVYYSNFNGSSKANGPILISDLNTPPKQSTDVGSAIVPQTSDFVRHQVGETFKSFRSLLKRYNHFTSFTLNEDVGRGNTVGFVLRRTPCFPGINSELNLCAGSVTLMSYLGLAYAFNSGSTRVKVNYNMRNVSTGNFMVGSATVNRGIQDSFATIGFNTNFNYVKARFGSGGEIFTNGLPAEFSIADSDNYLMFQPASDLVSPAAVDACAAVTYDFSDDGQYLITSDVYYAAGDDFNYTLFLGVPTLYFNSFA